LKRSSPIARINSRSMQKVNVKASTPSMIAKKVGFSVARSALRFASANPTCWWRISVITCST
jgi:hypothetical protein